MKIINRINLKNIIIIAVFGVVTLGLMNVASARMSEAIAVVVNEDAISESDVNDRLEMMMASSSIPSSPDVRAKLRPQITTVLIEEALKMQEARRLDIAVSEEEIEQGFATIAEQNNMSADQFRTVLGRSGVEIRTLYNQIRSQIGWTKVLQERIQPQIFITENEVNAIIDRIKANEGKTEYRVAEIFLAMDSETRERDVREVAQRLTAQVTEGRAPFPRLARQFSQSATASNGGDLGWIQQGQLDEELDTAIVRMEEGTVSRPIKTAAGYHVLYLRGKREITAESIPEEFTVRQQIGLERLDRMQRHYLMDLKSSAFIEQRNES
jgi:peptidyl-prolyl cis-trans isomerase SurA